MRYSEYFNTKFDQGDVVDSVLKIANASADLENVRNGVCQTMALLWVINSIRKASPESGFQELMKHDVGTGVGAAFWTQVCGGQKGIKGVAACSKFEYSQLLGTQARLLAGGNQASKITITFKADATPAKAESLSSAGGPYFLLALWNCRGRGGGHGIAFYNCNSKYAVVDPNWGLAPGDSGNLSGLFGAMSTDYGTADFTLYEVIEKIS